MLQNAYDLHYLACLEPDNLHLRGEHISEISILLNKRVFRSKQPPKSLSSIWVTDLMTRIIRRLRGQWVWLSLELHCNLTYCNIETQTCQWPWSVRDFDRSQAFAVRKYSLSNGSYRPGSNRTNPTTLMKASSSMGTAESGIEIKAKLEQFPNARFLIVVTERGWRLMTMLCNRKTHIHQWRWRSVGLRLSPTHSKSWKPIEFFLDRG